MKVYLLNYVNDDGPRELDIPLGVFSTPEKAIDAMGKDLQNDKFLRDRAWKIGEVVAHSGRVREWIIYDVMHSAYEPRDSFCGHLTIERMSITEMDMDSLRE